MRLPFGKFLAALAALLCLGAMAATVATAARTVVVGPKWKIAGHELKTNETVEVRSASSPGEITFAEETAHPIVVTCKKSTVTGASIVGGSPGTVKATLAPQECTVTGNGEGCTVESFSKGTIEGPLGYEWDNRSGKILALLKSSMIRVNFKGGGENCKLTSLETWGSLIGEVVVGGEPEKVGGEAAAKVVGLRFPTSPIKTIWTEQEGKLIEQEAKLAGPQTSFSGSAELELSGLQEWGAAANAGEEVPAWRVSEKYIGKGESVEVLSAGSAGEMSIDYGSGVVITCKKSSVGTSSIAGGSPGTLKIGSLSLSECSVTGAGSGCEVPNFKISALEGPLAYATKEGTGKILVLLKASGLIFKVGLNGANCKVGSIEGKGSLVGELVIGGKPDEVGNEAKAKIVGLRFPTSSIPTVWVDELNSKGEEILKEEEAKIIIPGGSAVIAGTTELELSGLQEWGAWGL
jgi:hypothetical protein